MPRRQRQKRVRRDALDRVGHHEEPHAHALHQPARERLGCDAHDGDPVHERGQRHHQTIVAADDLRETAQVEPRKRIAVDILANLDRAAQPVLHASARRRGRRGSGGMAGSTRQQRLALGIEIPMPSAPTTSRSPSVPPASVSASPWRAAHDS